MHEVDPVGVVLADVVHRQEHRPLALARQLDVALAVGRPNCPSSTHRVTHGNEVLFTADKATARNPTCEEVCVFNRLPGGLYIARLKLLFPFARQEK